MKEVMAQSKSLQSTMMIGRKAMEVGGMVGWSRVWNGGMGWGRVWNGGLRWGRIIEWWVTGVE